MTRFPEHTSVVRGGRSGFVLITALLILIVLAALGFGAVFLTNMNLRIAENTRSAAVARYSAEAGLDLALFTLAGEWVARNGSWPGLDALRSKVPLTYTRPGGELADVDFRIVALSTDGNEGTVTVEGSGPRGARFRTSARFEGRPPTPPTPAGRVDLSGIGFVTPGNITVTGNAKFGLNVWTGGTLTATGLAQNLGFEIKSYSDPCWVGSGGSGGNPNASGGGRGNPNAGPPATPCIGGHARPVHEIYEFDVGLAILSASRECTDVLASGTYDVTLRQGETLCIEPDAIVTLTGEASGLTVLGDESTTVRVDASTRGFDDEPDGVGLNLASGTVQFVSGGSFGEGSNTIFALESIKLERDVLVGEDGIVRTFIATEGDMRFEGAGMQEVYGIFYMNGDACLQGTLDVFYGAIMAGADASDGTTNLCGNFTGIDFRGAGGLEAYYEPEGSEIDNFPVGELIPGTSVGGVRVLARQ